MDGIDYLFDAPIQSIIFECAKRGRFQYFQAFEKYLNSNRKNELSVDALNATKILRSICGVPLSFNEAKLRFFCGEWNDYESGKVFSAKCFDESDAKSLYEYAIKLSDNVLGSILMDFLWTTKYSKRFECAKEAIRLYSQYLEINNLEFGVEPLAIMRALDLSYSIYNKKEQTNQATSFGLAYMCNLQASNYTHLHTQILRMLPIEEQASSTTLRNQLLSTADYLFNHRQFIIYREVLEHILLLMRNNEESGGNQQIALESRISESFICESEDVPQALSKAFFLGSV